MQPITPEEYFEKIKLLRTPEEIKSVCDELTSVLLKPDYAPKTRVNKLTPYNKVINTIPVEELVEGENAYIQTKEDSTLWKRHLHFKFTGLADTNWNGEGGINSGDTKITRLENRQKIDVNSYLKTTIKLLQSENPHELTVGLLAASGRRPIEVLVRGSFEEETKIPKYLKPGYFLKFTGQAKKRDYDIPEDERTEYRIGVLVPASLFLEAIERFDKMPESVEIKDFLNNEEEKGTSPEEINKKIEDKRGNSLRRVIEKEFNLLPLRDGHKKINAISLRAAYLRLITERDCPKNIDDLLWASRAVGHFIDNKKPDDSQLKHLVTTLGYSDYYVDEPVPFVGEESEESEKSQQPEKSELPEKSQQPEKSESPEKSELAEESQFLEKPQISDEHKQLVLRNRLSIYESDNETLKVIKEKHNFENNQDLVRYLIKQHEAVFELEKQVEQLKSAKAVNEKNQNNMQKINEPDLDKVIEQKIEAALQRLLPKIQNLQVNQSETQLKSETKASQTKPPKPEKDWESVPSEELKTTKVSGAALEKIRRAYLAITAHNDNATEKNQKWYVGLRILSELSGCNGQLISPWIAEHKQLIDDHNAKHELGVHHNKVHKVSITEVINW